MPLSPKFSKEFLPKKFFYFTGYQIIRYFKCANLGKGQGSEEIGLVEVLPVLISQVRNAAFKGM